MNALQRAQTFLDVIWKGLGSPLIPSPPDKFLTMRIVKFWREYNHILAYRCALDAVTTRLIARKYFVLVRAGGIKRNYAANKSMSWKDEGEEEDIEEADRTIRVSGEPSA